MSWPRGNVEQDIFVSRLEKQVARLDHTQKSLVIHSYEEPSRRKWEAEYALKFNGEAPIPPGMRLCWYDMRNGYMKVYMTTYDQDNGKNSSGAIYKATKNQYSNPIRFLGDVSVDGRVSPNGISSPDIVIGSNISTHKRRGLAMIELFLAFDIKFSGATELVLDFGTFCMEPEITTVSANDYVHIQGKADLGVLSETTILSSANSREGLLLSLDQTPAGKTSAVHMMICNPFGLWDDGSEKIQMNTVVLGTAYHYDNMDNNFPNITYFGGQRLHATNMGKDWRLKFDEAATGNQTDELVGFGFAYGHYVKDNNSNEEFIDVL